MERIEELAKDDVYAFISHSPSTYPSKTPEIDNAQLARRKRRRTSPAELAILEYEFLRCYKPSRNQREEIARKVGMTSKAVQIWFQNKRQSVRKASDSTSTTAAAAQRMNTIPDFDSSSGSLSSSRHSSFDSSSSMSSNRPSFAIYEDKARPAVPNVLVPPVAGLSNVANGSRPPAGALLGGERAHSASYVPTSHSHSSASNTFKSDARGVMSLANVLQPVTDTRDNRGVPRLSMSHDGKAVVEFGDRGKENRPVESAETKKMHHQHGHSKNLEEKEVECISNLLALRSGSWKQC